MPHIHTEPGQHDFTASAFIVRTDTPEPSIILHEHKKLGVFLQFGGHVELGETPWQAIAHELREESGYDLDQLLIYQSRSRIQQLTGVVLHPVPLAMNTHPFGMGLDHYHTDIEYAFATNEAPRHPVEVGESGLITLHTLEGIKKLPDEKIFANVREIAIFILEHVVNEWQSEPAANFA